MNQHVTKWKPTGLLDKLSDEHVEKVAGLLEDCARWILKNNTVEGDVRRNGNIMLPLVRRLWDGCQKRQCIFQPNWDELDTLIDEVREQNKSLLEISYTNMDAEAELVTLIADAYYEKHCSPKTQFGVLSKQVIYLHLPRQTYYHREVVHPLFGDGHERWYTREYTEDGYILRRVADARLLRVLEHRHKTIHPE